MQHVPLFAALLVLGCGATQEDAQSPEDVVRTMQAPEQIIDLRTGEEVDEETMLADLRSVRAIYLGERHDQALDHAMQYRIFRALYRDDASLVIGMEMFQRPFQSVADDWVAGRLDEDALRRLSEWDDRWGFDIRLYRPILQFIRSRGVPLYALNAPKELTRAVALTGIEALSEEQQSELPEMVLDDAEHRAMIEEALGDHPHSEDQGAMDRLYAAQVVWDETMAQTVAEAIEAGASRIIVFAGAMHVRAGLGIPKRAARRGADSYRVVLAGERGSDEVELLSTAEPRAADYLWLY